MSQPPSQPVDSMRKMPRQGRAWQTVRTIFEATFQLLQRHGENRLTTNHVAERAGFSVGTLYQYFPSMDSILLAMIDLERRRIMAHLDSLLAQAEATQADPRETLRLYVRALIAAFGTGDAARRMLLKRAWRLDYAPPAVAAVQESVARFRLHMERRGHPDFPVPDPVVLFVLTRASMGAIRAAVLEDSPLVETPEFEDALVQAALALLASRQASPGNDPAKIDVAAPAPIPTRSSPAASR